MSRESRKMRKRGGSPRVPGGALARSSWYKLGGGVAVLLGLLLFAVTYRADGHHPAPRAELDHASHVVAGDRYEAYPRVQHVYELVAAVPMIVDGIYCYCHCAEHSDHYSLLDCFASDHAARCDVCLSEATMASQMTQDGYDLKAIRAEIDARYRS